MSREEKEDYRRNTRDPIACATAKLTRTMITTCKNLDANVERSTGAAPSSWKIMVTISLPFSRKRYK